ncbi:hypothetical protein [Phytobacter diazotrophicus]|uniref:hypothetical protein n=1 Tax=Phytobacter diazotrophicus TaxID=395631 RepID=UPI0029366B17|nr:hypothetical protein [Phytobacter diazotrophicus]MDV2874487.1 hypothetical protein [Phytobacter diazotrophicus]
MKPLLFIVPLLALSSSISSHASQIEDDKREIQRLLDDKDTPYLGPGRSMMDAYKDTADAMVEKYGEALSEIGMPPNTIRSTTLFTCKDAENAAQSASSASELELWERAKLSSIADSGSGYKISEAMFLRDATIRCYKLSKILYLLDRVIKNKDNPSKN